MNWKNSVVMATSLLETIQGGRQGYTIRCDLPQRTRKHVIFHIWQRADSPEAFYSCNDVKFKGGIVHDNFREIGRVSAMENLEAGTTIVIHVLDRLFGDWEHIELVLEEGEGSPMAWPFLLAQKVNAGSSFIRIGTLTEEGRVEPTRTQNGNRVLSDSTRQLRIAIEKEAPEGAPDGGPGGYPDGDPNGPPPPLTYPKEIGSCQPETVLKGTDGNLYQCKPFPFSGWCNQAPRDYAPDTGLAWNQAWILTRKP